MTRGTRRLHSPQSIEFYVVCISTGRSKNIEAPFIRGSLKLVPLERVIEQCGQNVPQKVSVVSLVFSDGGLLELSRNEE